MTLDDLVAQLRAAYTDSLRAVALYGSAAGGEHHARHSDYNVLVVVRALSLEAMRAAGAVARAWEEAGNPVPLTLTEAEWRSSVDVFAIEHADIKERHRVLFAADGFDLFRGINVSPRDLRQQLEYEALGTLLRLRGRILASGDDPKIRTGLLAASASQVLVLFRALLRLSGEAPPSDNEALCRAAAARAGFDAAPFVAVVAHRRGTEKLDRAGVGKVLAGYHEGLERVVAYLDTLDASNTGSRDK
jgi:predicted nucleotidyltransferase